MTDQIVYRQRPKGRNEVPPNGSSYSLKELPYKGFQKWWTDIHHLKNMTEEELFNHISQYKLVKKTYPDDHEDYESLDYLQLSRTKKIYNEHTEKCVCNVSIKYKFYITDVNEPDGYMFIIGSECMKNWGIKDIPHCFICKTNLSFRMENKMVCKKCVDTRCIKCKGDISNSDQFMNKKTFRPITPDGNLCGDCKSDLKLCRRCGINRVGQNKYDPEKVYFYCYPCKTGVSSKG